MALTREQIQQIAQKSHEDRQRQAAAAAEPDPAQKRLYNDIASGIMLKRRAKLDGRT